MKIQKQRYKKDCAICAICNLTGFSYRKVKWHVLKHARGNIKNGIGHDVTLKVLRDLGYFNAKRFNEFETVTKRKVVAEISVKSKNIIKLYHALVWNGYKIIDASRKKQYKHLNDVEKNFKGGIVIGKKHYGLYTTFLNKEIDRLLEVKKSIMKELLSTVDELDILFNTIPKAKSINEFKPKNLVFAIKNEKFDS